MRDMYNLLPEFMVDATLKLLNCRFPVFLMMSIDGNDLSEIVSVFILSEETKLKIKEAVKFFQKHNPTYVKTKVIMSDKDFVGEMSFQGYSPNHLC